MNFKEELAKTEHLSALVYLNSLLTYKDAGLLGDIAKKMATEEEEVWPCRMSKEEWMKVINRAINDPVLKRFRLVKAEDIKKTVPYIAAAGHRAVLFGDGTAKGYVIFRGTGSEEEWEDNAKGMVEADTLQQRAAARFVLEACQQFPHITVAGHSKGGNKAQYAAITLPENTVEQCFSFDGQGFSAAFFKKYSTRIESRKSIVNLISERRGIVHTLGRPVGKTTYYIGRRGEPCVKFPHGNPLSLFHCPDALRTSTGNIGPESFSSHIPAVVNRLVNHFAQSPKHSLHWEKTAYGLTSLMSGNKKAAESVESVGAIAQVLLVLIDLIAEEEDFRKQITDMVFMETEVLLASLGSVGTLSGLNKQIVRKLAQRLVAEQKARKNFIKAIRFMIVLRRGFITGRHIKLSEYIAEGIHIALKILSKTLTNAGPVLNKIQKSWNDHKRTHELLDYWELLENEVKAETTG